MLKQIAITVSLFLITNAIVHSAETSPYQFLRYNSGARAAALAGATVSMPGDGTMMFYNPAVLPTVKDKMMNVTFLKHVLDINSGNASYIRHFDEIGTFSAGVVFTNYGSFDAADKLGNKNGTFSANDVCVNVAYGNELDTNLYYGAAVKFIYVGLDDVSSSAMAFDFGMLYTMPEARTNIGISILNAGFQLSKFYSYSESLPLDIRIGINHRLKGLPLLANFSFHHLADKEDNFFDRLANFSIGGEIYLGEKLMARIGYDNQIRRMTTPANDKQMAGLSAGVGLKMTNFNVDYAISRIGLGATLHRFGLSLNI